MSAGKFDLRGVIAEAEYAADHDGFARQAAALARARAAINELIAAAERARKARSLNPAFLTSAEMEADSQLATILDRVQP